MEKLLLLFSVDLLNRYYEQSKQNITGLKGRGLADSLFPPMYKNSFDLKVKNGGKTYTPQVLEVSSLDVDPKIRGFATSIELVKEKPLFREKMTLNEQDRKNLLEVVTRGNQEEIDLELGQIVDQIASANGFLGSVSALNALMVGQFLSSGQIKVSVNKEEKAMDYGLDAKLKETLTSTHKWSDAQATPLDDLIRWSDTVVANGGNVGLAIMTTKVFNLIKNSAQVKKLLESAKVIFPSQIKTFVEEYTGLKIVIWDEKVKLNELGQEINVFSDKVVTLVPESTLGAMEYGPTPARTDKLFGAVGANEQIDDLKGTYASLQVLPTSESGVIKNMEIVLSSVNLPNPTCLKTMFIGTVID